MIMIKLKKIINFIQSPWIKISYKKNINPLKDVKQAQKPLNKIFSFNKLNLFAITNPKNNDPIMETMRLLFMKILKNVARKQRSN